MISFFTENSFKLLNASVQLLYTFHIMRVSLSDIIAVAAAQGPGPDGDAPDDTELPPPHPQVPSCIAEGEA